MSRLDEMHKAWTQEEDNALLQHYQEHGCRWDRYQELVPGRTVHAIRIRFMKLMEKMEPKEEANLPERVNEKRLVLTEAIFPEEVDFGSETRDSDEEYWDFLNQV
jgi:hypothetical protein